MTDPLILAAVADFMMHLLNRTHPLVVGANYPRAQMIEEFEKWAASRRLAPHYIDMKSWHEYWNK